MKESVRDSFPEKPEPLSLTALGEIERSKKAIPKQEQPSEVLIQSLGFAGVMPAMKSRRRYYVAERAKRPPHVGMNEDRPERQQSRRGAEYLEVESQQGQRGDHNDLPQRLIDGMQPDRRQPIQFLTAVMNGVKRPKRSAVKQPVLEIPQKVSGDQCGEVLEEYGEI